MKKTALILCFLFALAARSQGCSDAGICSIAQPGDDVESQVKNEIEIMAIAGAGEADTEYFSPQISYTRNFNPHWSASAKITSSFASGVFGKRGSLGDAFLTGIYTPKTDAGFRWTYSAGVKIPFNRANLKINNHPLPMEYQSSLGTFDLLTSANLNYMRWDFSAALQIPTININANSYFTEYSGTTEFQSTNLFERKPDALLRATYTFKPKSGGFSFKPNVLVIYHLGEDTFENITGERVSIAGSDGLTVNGNLITTYDFAMGRITLSVAAPFVVRDVRPDGLTREYTIGLGYTAKF